MAGRGKMTPSRLKHLVVVDGLILMQSPNVHIPDAYSEFLAECVDVQGVSSACDLTTGCGYHALCLAANGIQTVAIDKSPAAASLTSRNIILNNLVDKIEVRCGDLYDSLDPEERFDCLVAWPPVMPVPRTEELDDWWSTANSGGPLGRDVMDRVIAGAPPHLAREGSLWLAQPWYLSLRQTRDIAAAAGLEAEEVGRKRFPLGPVSRSRLPYLASLGFEPVYRDVEPVQEITVLRLHRVTA
jgi:release factor glutamine methyltransferase